MRIDKLFRWVGWYRLPGSNGRPLDPQSRVRNGANGPVRLAGQENTRASGLAGDTPKRSEMAEHDKNRDASPYKSPYSEAADHERRDREPRRPEGCAGVVAYLVIVWLAVIAGGVWIWRG